MPLQSVPELKIHRKNPCKRSIDIQHYGGYWHIDQYTID